MCHSVDNVWMPNWVVLQRETSILQQMWTQRPHSYNEGQYEFYKIRMTQINNVWCPSSQRRIEYNNEHEELCEIWNCFVDKEAPVWGLTTSTKGVRVLSDILNAYWLVDFKLKLQRKRLWLRSCYCFQWLQRKTAFHP